MLLSTFAVAVAIMNYNMFDNHMVSKLFRVEKSSFEKSED
jgi:hypothetical protein